MPDFINVWAIIGSMILSVVLGFVWYGPLFGKTWMKLSGIVMPNPRPGMEVMVKPIILSLIGSLFMSFALTSAIEFHNTYWQVVGYGAALSFAAFLWLGFIVPVYLNFSGWEQKPWTLFFINVGYWLVFLLLSATLITALG